MKKIWHPVKKIFFKDLGSNLLLVKFEDCTNKKIVQKEEGPWSFDKNLVLIKEFEGETQINKITIMDAAFWIRLYDIPLHAMNERVARMIGASIGLVEDIDVEQGEVARGEFIRIKVRTDISKSLMRGRYIHLGS